MNHTEKILLFRTCGMVLWLLKQIALNSSVHNKSQRNTVTKVDQLIKDITDCINYLREKQDKF